jgi:hypothetical protein
MMHVSSLSSSVSNLQRPCIKPKTPPPVRFGTYTPEATYNLVIRDVEAGMEGHKDTRRRYEAEVASIERRRAEFEEMRKQGSRFQTARRWDRIETHYDRYRDVLLHLERIGLYTQAEWIQDPKAQEVIQSAVKLIPQLEPYTAKALRKFAMKESVGVLPPAISDAVETFYEAHQDESTEDRHIPDYNTIGERYGITPRSIPTERDPERPVQYHIGQLVGVAGNNHGALSIQNVRQKTEAPSPEHQLVGALLQTLYTGIQTDQLTHKAATTVPHAAWLDQVESLHKVLPSIPTEAAPQAAMNRIVEMRRELDAGQAYLNNLTELLMSQLKDLAKEIQAGGKA